jgi:[ribosomal protein S5]-alanine N-acetyltransferase
VMEKVGARKEGLAERYLCIAGKWEDHAIFAVTSEEWAESTARGAREESGPPPP